MQKSLQSQSKQSKISCITALSTPRQSIIRQSSNIKTERSRRSTSKKKDIHKAVYVEKLIQFAKRVTKQNLFYSQMIEQLQKKLRQLKKLHQNQEWKLQRSDSRLAKQEYVNQYLRLKESINKIQQLMITLNDDFLVSKDKYKQQIFYLKNTQTQKQRQLKLLKDEQQFQKEFLRSKQVMIKVNQQKIEENKKLIESKQKIQKQYLKLIERLQNPGKTSHK